MWVSEWGQDLFLGHFLIRRKKTCSFLVVRWVRFCCFFLFGIDLGKSYWKLCIQNPRLTTVGFFVPCIVELLKT